MSGCATWTAARASRWTPPTWPSPFCDPANTACQRDRSVPLVKLGDLAVVQGDLSGALSHYSESRKITERLAASDPANAGWQREL